MRVMEPEPLREFIVKCLAAGKDPRLEMIRQADADGWTISGWDGRYLLGIIANLEAQIASLSGTGQPS